jgi:pyruvate dehydrogenase (quinone)
MLLGDLLTTIQEKLPIKIVVFNNSSLNFVELEQKVEGLLDHYTDLLNPDFGKLASVIGLHGQTVTHGDGLEQAVENFLNMMVLPYWMYIPIQWNWSCHPIQI